MTDKPEQRYTVTGNASEDMDYLMDLTGKELTAKDINNLQILSQHYISRTMDAEPEEKRQRLRAEAAEQERDKLEEDNMWMQSMLASIRGQVNLLNVLDKEKRFKEVIDHLYFQIDVSLNREKHLAEDQPDGE